MSRLRAVVPMVGAAALAAIAVVTVRSAGCADPGHYELRGDGYALVGGCIAPGDLVVPQPPSTAPTPPAPAAEPGHWPARS